MNDQQPNQINTSGGANINGNLNTGGGHFIGRDQIVVNIASGTSILAILTFAFVITDFVFNLVDPITGLSARSLWICAGVMGALAWCLSIWVLRAKRGVDEPTGYYDGDINRPILKQVATFTGLYRTIAKFTAWAIPILAIIAIAAYYIWRILPAQQTTILIADFVAPSGTDEARVTEILVNEIRSELTDIEGIRVKRLRQVIELENGSEEAMRIGEQPQHKATVVIWGNYAIVDGDPEVHVHFDIVQSADTYLESGFDTSYGSRQIGQLLQIEQPDMFDFKIPLGQYLGQMSAFTVGLTLFETYRYNEAIPLFETAGKAIGQPLAADMERAIRFYRGTNYLSLNRAKDAKPDLKALIPELTENSVVFDSIALAALGNLGVVASNLGNYRAAQGYYEQALRIHTQLGNPLKQANQMGNLGNVAIVQGDYEAARSYHEQALKIRTQLGNFLGQAADLNNLANVAFSQGDYEVAQGYLEQALKIDTQLGNSFGLATTLSHLGLMALSQGDYETARNYHEQALRIHTQFGNSLGLAANLSNLGLMAFSQGDYEAARGYHEQALKIHTQLGYPLGQAANLSNLGLLFLELEEFDTARDYYEQSAELHRSMGLDVHPAVLNGLTALEGK